MSATIRCAFALTLAISAQAYRIRADGKVDEQHSGEQLVEAKTVLADGALLDAGDNRSFAQSLFQAVPFHGHSYSWLETSQNSSNLSDACLAKVKSLSVCKDVGNETSSSFRVRFFDCTQFLSILQLDEQSGFEIPSECKDDATDNKGQPWSYGCCKRTDKEMRTCCEPTTFGLIFVPAFTLTCIFGCCVCLCCSIVQL
eukprot:TRINITY_DN54058_c0_g1_i1.p1 TRINITY_DN54058_c0_g1~~TRINITY_DN54058_c0_g1_i1.p1  ORF type:complete len:199 (+),score=21.57 TRINITY_DN54058_c0_g1_i1:48-644(+)